MTPSGQVDKGQFSKNVCVCVCTHARAPTHLYSRQPTTVLQTTLDDLLCYCFSRGCPSLLTIQSTILGVGKQVLDPNWAVGPINLSPKVGMRQAGSSGSIF